MTQLRWNRTDRDGTFDIAPGASQHQQVAEVDAYSVTGGCPLSLDGDATSTDENVGVVPVDEHLFHFESVELSL